MDQKAYLAITAMLNGFPQGSSNPDLTMGTYEAVLRDVSSQAVIEAAQRFVSGLVPGQHASFAPSVAEFAQEARARQEIIDLKNRRQIEPPKHYHGNGRSPWERNRDKALAANAHLPVLFEDVSYDAWCKLSKAREIPVGAKWVACLATVYGPAQ